MGRLSPASPPLVAERSAALDVRISLTERLSVEANGASLDEQRFPGRQGRIVFAYLAAQQGSAVPRDELADVLWGEDLPATWEKALRVLMTKLRALLEECGIDGSAALTSAFGCYKLTLPAGAWIDVDAAVEAVERAEAALAAGDVEAARSEAATAAALARRSFLPGEDGSWVEGRRRDLREVLVRSLECQRDASLAEAELAEAVRYGEEVIELEPFRESGYRRLMQAHTAAGNPAEALRVYERCRRFLSDELGAYPSPETEAVYLEVLRDDRVSTTENGVPVVDARAGGRLVARGKADHASITNGEPFSVAPIDRPRLHVRPLPSTFYLVVNPTRPPFDELRARRAVNYALDRNKIVRLGGSAATARPTCQVLPPNFPGYRPYCPYSLDAGPGSPWTAPDRARAGRLVTASGTAGAEVELWWHRNFGVPTGRYLEQQLDSLGFRARLRLFSGDIGKYFSALEQPRASWHLAGSGWFADYPAASNFINLLACSSQFNIGRFCNRAIDGKIRQALRIQRRDPAAANALWAALDRELTDQAPWVFLSTMYSGDFVSKRVGNYQHHPLWGTLLAQLWVQ